MQVRVYHRRLRRLQIDPRSISACFVSHMHPDHCMGLPMFIQANYLLKRVEPLAIYVPSEAVGGVKQLFNLTYLFPHKVPFDLVVRGIEEGFTIQAGDVTVSAIPNSHLKNNVSFLADAGLANRMQCFSFVVKCGIKRLAYSADVGSLDEILPGVAGADLLILDAMHTDLTRLPEVAVKTGLKKIMLTHMSDDFDSSGVETACAKQGVTDVYRANEGDEILI